MASNIDKAQAFMSSLSDNDIERSWEEAKAATHAERKKAFLRKVPILSATVVLLALIPIGIRVVESRVGWEESTYAEFSEAISAMNASHTNSSISNSILGSNIAYVKIGDHVAMYDRLSSETMDLTSYQGRLFAEGPSSEVHSLDVLGNKDCQASCDCKWYRLKGVRNLQYLIKEDANGELSAWQFGLFMSFQEGAWRKLFPEEVKKEAEYGCRERLEVLCQVSSAKDIARIEVLPGASTLLSSTIPVTEYRKYEEEIRTKTIEDHRTIEELLTIFRNMKDVLSSPQDIQAHLRVFRSELMRNNVETSWLAGELGPLMRYDRKIRLVFSDGSNTLLTYSAVSGAFSYYGKKCVELGDKDMTRVNMLFGIDTAWILPSDFAKEDNSNSTPSTKDPSEHWSDYDGGCYETPCGTLVVCIKQGGEAYTEQIISAHKADYVNIHTRFVPYSYVELKAAVHMLSEQMKDQNSENEFSHGILAFGISEVYNRVSIYINNFKNEGIDSIYASITSPELVQVISLD